MIKTSDIFLRNEGQQLDFSSGELDLFDMFNSSAETVNKLLIDTGAEDPILEDIKGNASEANDDFNMFSSKHGESQTPKDNFGFEKRSDQDQQNQPTIVDSPSDGNPTGKAHKSRKDIPYNGTPASVRYNNPAAAYPRESDNKYGIVGFGVLKAGKQGTHKIGRFPSPVHGGAANFDLFASNYKGLTMRQAVSRWRGNGGRGEKVVVPKGYDPNQKITGDFLNDPNRAIDFFRKMAIHETGSKQALSDSQWKEAWKMWKAGGASNYKKQSKKGQ